MFPFLVLFAFPAAQAALIPTLPVQTSSVAGGALQSGLYNISSAFNTTISTFSGLIPQAATPSLPSISPLTSSAVSVVADLSLLISGLNPLSLAVTSLQISSAVPNSGLNNVFNGINVAFRASSPPIPSILASVTSSANEVIPTATGSLQAAVASIFPTSSISAANSVLSSGNETFSASRIKVFSFTSQASESLSTTISSLRPAFPSLSVFVSTNQVSSSPTNTSNQLFSRSLRALSTGVAAFISQNGTSRPSFALASPTSDSAPLRCTNISSRNSPACSLIPGSVVPLRGSLPCGTCPKNAGLPGVSKCPWICAIMFFGTGVYVCSPTDITGQTFPDSGALNTTIHLAEAVCHQCAAPCIAAASSARALPPVNTTTVFSLSNKPGSTNTSKELSCTNRPSSAMSPCCKPYGSRGNLVCASCPVDTSQLAACPWLCRMPYAEDRIDLECSPIDLTGVNLPSPYNETVQCERCKPPCSLSIAASSATTCVLSTTLAVSLAPKAPLVAAAKSTVTAVTTTCTNRNPGSPAVSCTGGPDFSTLFCLKGCPTIFTSQCTFLCMATLSNAFGGLFPAVQCAPVDLSLISPGRITCQQCYPQCDSNTTEPSSGLSLGVSKIANLRTRITARTETVITSPTCTYVSPSAIDSPPSQDNNTGLLFRSSCGVSAATVAQCPYLCSQGGGAFFQECSDTDISGEEPTSQFPPIVCTHCLPPCGNSSVSSYTRISSESMLEGPNSGSRPAAGNGSASLSKFTLVTSPSSTSALSQTPLALAGSPMSISSTVRSVEIFTLPFSSNLASSTKIALSTATCASVIPLGTDSPAIIEPNTGLLVRSSCGFTTETVAQCPFICSAGGGASNGNCYMEDMTGRLMYGSWPPMVCRQCLPPCKAVTTASASPTCSSVAPNAPDASPFVDLSGLLYRGSCGSSATTVAECPYLCGLAGESIVPRQCFHQDLTNKKIVGLFGDVGLLTCEKCLPPCGKSALPSCTSDYSSEVISISGAVPTSATPVAITSRAAALSNSPLPAPLQAGGLLPLVIAERDIADAFQRRDLVHAVVEGPSPPRLQLTCGNTAETVAACPFLCSPFNGDTQTFRRCAAIDLTNDFIGVNRVTCERCLPLCPSI